MVSYFVTNHFSLPFNTSSGLGFNRGKLGLFCFPNINVSIFNARSKNSLYIITKLKGKRLCREIRVGNGEELEGVSFGPLVPSRDATRNVFTLMGQGVVLEMDTPDRSHGNLTEVGTVQGVSLCKRCDGRVTGWSSSSSSSDSDSSSESGISDYLTSNVAATDGVRSGNGDETTAPVIASDQVVGSSQPVECPVEPVGVRSTEGVGESSGDLQSTERPTEPVGARSTEGIGESGGGLQLAERSTESEGAGTVEGAEGVGGGTRSEAVQLTSEVCMTEIPVIDLEEVSADPFESGQELVKADEVVPSAATPDPLEKGSHEDARRAQRKKERASLQRERRRSETARRQGEREMGESRSGHLIRRGVVASQERVGYPLHNARAGTSRDLVVKLNRVDPSARRENGKDGSSCTGRYFQ